jgi:integrase
MSSVMAAYIQHCDTLRSPDTAKHHAARIGQWLEGRRASEARQVAAHIVRDMTGHYAPATINRSLGALKKALTIAWETGHTIDNHGAHIKRLPEHNQRDTTLTLDQVRQITDHASEQVRAAVWIALLTGCRRGEVLHIQPEDIGPDSITIRAGNTKTLRTRIVPIVAALRPWLAFIPIKINAEGLKTGFRRAREAAGMTHIHFHDLRHACATILLARGADLYTIAKILGHSTIRVTERYAHHQVQAQKAALDRAFSAQITPGIAPGQKKRA